MQEVKILAYWIKWSLKAHKSHAIMVGSDGFEYSIRKPY